MPSSAPVPRRDHVTAADPTLATETLQAGTPAVPAGDTDESHRADASGQKGADHVASVDALSAAIGTSGVSRLAVMSSGEGVKGRGSVRLARRIAATSPATVVLIDLTGGFELSKAMGIAFEPDGFADLVGGRAELADVIHRDHYSRVHVVPSGGFSWDALGTEGQVKLFLAAFNEVYDRVVVECDASAADHLAALMNEETALIVSSDDASSARRLPIIERLRDAGATDVIVLQRA